MNVRDLPENFVKTWQEDDDREDMVNIIYEFLKKTDDNIIVTLLMSNNPDIPDTEYYNWASIIELFMYMYGTGYLYTSVHNGIPGTWEKMLKKFINNFISLWNQQDAVDGLMMMGGSGSSSNKGEKLRFW